jgi:hypothetical protein
VGLLGRLGIGPRRRLVVERALEAEPDGEVLRAHRHPLFSITPPLWFWRVEALGAREAIVVLREDVDVWHAVAVED